MPVCINCSASFEGYVCPKCGSPQHRPGPPLLTGKLMGPTAWLMAGLAAGGVVLGGVALVLAVSLIRDLMPAAERPLERSHHATLALARLLTATHLELEVLSIDPTENTVTLRHRKTGSVVTQDLESARKGQFRFTEVPLKPAASGASAEAPTSFRVPEWIPAYPLTHPRGSMSEASAGSFGFQTSDAAAEVIAFYQEGLRRSGFQITATGTHAGESRSTEGMLSAMDPTTGRNVGVAVSDDGPMATVTVTYGLKPASAGGSGNP